MDNIAPITLAKCAANYSHTFMFTYLSFCKTAGSCKERGYKYLTLTWTKSDKFIKKRTSSKVTYSTRYMSYVFVITHHDLHIQ